MFSAAWAEIFTLVVASVKHAGVLKAVCTVLVCLGGSHWWASRELRQAHYV